VDEKLTWNDRIERAWDSVKEIVGKVWLYVIIGIAVGAGIHGYVPESALANIMGKQVWWSVPAAVILRRVLKLPLLVTFFAVIAVAIIFIGYLFNIIL